MSRSYSTSPRGGRKDRPTSSIDLFIRYGHASLQYDRYVEQVRRRRINDRAEVVNPLSHFTDEELRQDVHRFVPLLGPEVSEKKLLRAAQLAKDIRLYDEVARGTVPDEVKNSLPVQLEEDEARELRRERDSPFSQRGMWTTILVISLAAFLQGFVQSSFNGASLYEHELGLDTQKSEDNYKLGAVNASPFLFAALVGCPLALPVNYWMGRKGGMAVAALLVLISSVAAPFALDWTQLFAIRAVNGLGMGLKAVSTPLLASECSVGFWRGSSILAWQLWVAFGIMIGFAFNFIFSAAKTEHLQYQLILGAPLVPAAVLLVVILWLCDESPRYLMRRSGPNYDPARAYKILRKLRNTELQSLRDIYVAHHAIEQEDYSENHLDSKRPNGRLGTSPHSVLDVFAGFVRQFIELFTQRRNRNALIAASVVNLSQQLCGINVLAFYSGTLFSRAGAVRTTAMEYSLGFGAINFLFGLPAIRTIDTLGRRKWLLSTLPLMAIFMAAAALSFSIKDESVKVGVVALWLFLFAAAYSPGLGPIPFTLASESFPLSHREAGAAFAIAVNLGFAGLLSISFPSINSGLGDAGSLGLFAGLNVVAFLLTFFLVEETKKRSLEDLDLIFAVPKGRFMKYQLTKYLPWFIKYYVFWMKDAEKPSLYIDRIWGGPEYTAVDDGRLEDEETWGGQIYQNDGSLRM